MEVKVGVQHAAREVIVETDASADEVEAQVAEALKSDGMLTLTDNKGRKAVIPGAKIAYVEIGGGVTGTVGFRS